MVTELDLIGVYGILLGVGEPLPAGPSLDALC